MPRKATTSSTEEPNKIESVQDFVSALERDYGAYKGDVWYRGHSNHEWPLLPGYLRLDTPTSEATLLTKFRQSASLLLNLDPKDDFDWLFIMQHYGVPTRLLDWSENPLVALYFAALDDPEQRGNDSAVWCIKPSLLNKNANIDSDEEFFIPSFNDEFLKSYTIESLVREKRVKLYPIATIATRNNSRIQAQQGVFTIHHREAWPIEDIGDKSHINKYTIPFNRKDHISKQLKVLGITKFSMFPELSSIGDNIRQGLS